MRPRPRMALTLTFLIGALVTSDSFAGDIGDKASFHGYGSWAYAETDGNLYLGGNEKGSYDNVSLALNISSSVSQRLTVFGQFQLYADEEDVKVDLDFAFADWRLGPSLHARFGQVKHPFGIYTDIYDVGTLRPFIDLPQGLYGPQGISAEAYRGAGLVGEASVGSDWGLQYDVYAGSLESELWSPGMPATAFILDYELDEDYFSVDSREVVGVRLNFSPPIPGLLFGMSAFRGSEDKDAAQEEMPPGFENFPGYGGNRTAWGAHVEYLGEKLWTRAEYAAVDVDQVTFWGSYVELAYKLDGHWQVAGRYDVGEIDTIEFEPAVVEPTKALDHEDLAAAVNYWFSPEMVIKLEYHAVDGTRFAGPGPEIYYHNLLAGTFETETQLIKLGAQFSF
jgi:hypothetical protein